MAAEAPSIISLAEAALSGDLLFVALPGEDLTAVYASALSSIGSSLKQHVRPTAQPEDLVRLLAHNETSDLAHGMLGTLIVDKTKVPEAKAKESWTGRKWLLAGHGRKELGPELTAANIARLSFLHADLVDAIFVDFERRVSSLCALLLDGEEAAGSAPAKTLAVQVGRSAEMLVAIYSQYTQALLAPAARRMGFERLTRTCTLALKSVFSVFPESTASPHLMVAIVWRHVHTTVNYFWDQCGVSAVTSAMVTDEWTRAMEATGAAFGEAAAGISNSKDPSLLKSQLWSQLLMSVLDVESISGPFSLAGGLDAAVREASDAANKYTTTLLIALSNGARSPATAAKAVELGAHQKLQPLTFHDDPSIAFWACHAICLLANHPETQGTVDASGCLTDVTGVLRLLTLPYAALDGDRYFLEDDITSMRDLCKTDNPLPLRMCGAMKLGSYCRGATAALAKGAKEPLAILERSGVDSVGRVLCVDPDAFLYLSGIALLHMLTLPLPMYRDPARAAAAAAATAHDTAVLFWTIDAVCDWVGKQPFRQYRQLFRDCLVDGTMLATLSDAELSDMGMSNTLHRKAVRSAIGRLLFKSGLSYEHAVVAASPASAAVEPNGHLLHTVTGADVGLSSTPFMSPPRPLVVVGGGGGGGSGGFFEHVEAKRTDVFISYRRKTGAVLARLLDLHLRMAGLTTFLDVENLGTGAFDVALKSQLSGANNVVVILSEGALDRCLTDHDNKDFVRKEIAMALATSKNTVPVLMDVSRRRMR